MKCKKKEGLLYSSADAGVLSKFMKTLNIFINTTCIWEVEKESISAFNIKYGNEIILTNSVEIMESIFIAQNDLGLNSNIKSDYSNLYLKLENIFNEDLKINALRDASRGGIASAFNEWIISSSLIIEINEKRL